MSQSEARWARVRLLDLQRLRAELEAITRPLVPVVPEPADGEVIPKRRGRAR